MPQKQETHAASRNRDKVVVKVIVEFDQDRLIYKIDCRMVHKLADSIQVEDYVGLVLHLKEQRSREVSDFNDPPVVFLLSIQHVFVLKVFVLNSLYYLVFEDSDHSAVIETLLVAHLIKAFQHIKEIGYVSR